MRFFDKDCPTCKAHEGHIASLVAEIEQKNGTIGAFRHMLDNAHSMLEEFVNKQDENMKHLLGMDKQQAAAHTELTSIPRRHGIQSRIMRAESQSADPTLTAQRRREYDDRINSLLNPVIKPEVEVVEEKENAV